MREKHLSWVIYMLLTACLCSPSFCQNPQDISFQMLDTTLGKIDALTLRLEEMHAELGAIKDSQTAQEEKVEDVLTKLSAVEGQMEELHGSTGPNSQLDIFIKALEMEKNLCTMMVNGTWRKEVEVLRESLDSSWSREVAALQESLTAEIEKVKEDTEVCSSKDQIRNIKDLLAKDECSDGSNTCSPYATCEDAVVDYRCKCLPGYSGDGFTCTAHASCDSPSQFVRGLGCITPIKENKTWEEARQNCQDKESRLLEGLTTQEQLDKLKEHFSDLLKRGRFGVWIGLKMWKWHQGGDHVDEASPLWHTSGDEPTKGADKCGVLWLHLKKPAMGDAGCWPKLYSLCQKK